MYEHNEILALLVQKDPNNKVWFQIMDWCQKKDASFFISLRLCELQKFTHTIG